MFGRKRPTGKKFVQISTRLFLQTGLLFLISILVMIAATNWRMRSYALAEAKEKAMMILDRNLAAHTYFSHQLKPALFKKLKPLNDNAYFDPVWMSSTYAVREMDKYFKQLHNIDYYYKECAVNARSPENEADPFEREFIFRLNQSSGVNELSAIWKIQGDRFFVVLRRGESMDQSCLRCHSTPGAAPADMVAQYGPERSFNRYEGEVVSAISIRIPVEKTFADINRLTLNLALFFCVILVALFASIIAIHKHWLFDPLGIIREKASGIADDPDSLGVQMVVPKGRELADLAMAFNSMSTKLRQERDQLETRVDQRTAQLGKVNENLAAEVAKHQQTIADLEKALTEIRSLRGILPICSHCKKIRDDQGYWKQLETYITEHSDADFSHSICPDCAKKHYSDLDLYDE